jgi:hypothetical protein
VGRVFVCDLTAGPLVVPDQDCPNAAAHTPHPTGYVANSVWADEMLARGWEPGWCGGGCRKWNVWTPPATAGPESDPGAAARGA